MHRLFTAACLAILALCVPVAVAYPPEAAPFTPTHHEMTLPDPGRRDVPIRVYAPAKPDSQADSKAEDSKADGPFPLIVFSHGAGGDRSAFESLGNDLAAHGYVVVFPTHADSIKLRREQGETIDPRTEP